MRQFLPQGFRAVELLNLLLKEAQVWRDLAPKGLDLFDVLFSLQELLLALLLLEFVHSETERVFKHLATLARMRDQYPVRLALGDDVVSRPPDTGGGKEFGDVPEAHFRSVHGVLAHPVPEHLSLDDDLVEIELELPLRVIEDDGNRGTRGSRRSARSGKNKILAPLPAHALHGLFAKRKAE